MALKPRHKRRIFWSIISAIATIGLLMVLIPPMITLNSFRPTIEQSIRTQTNVPVKLGGSLHFSLLGGATIAAHDVEIPNAKIGTVLFSIPFRSFFNLGNSKLNDAVVIYDANITVDKLVPAAFNHNIEIYNSNITFMGRKFHIIRADFTNGQFHGTIRSQNHKYEVEFIGDFFTIKNKNNNLDLTGRFYSDGSIRGHMDLETQDINEWFGFEEPQIKQTVKLSTDFYWDGHDTYEFTNLHSDKFSGNITVSGNGTRTVQLVSPDIDFDFSFLMRPTKLFHKTKFDIDFYGALQFGNKTFKHLKIDVIATTDKLQITNVIADDIVISGGTITKNGAEKIMITMPYDGVETMCLFSGNPDTWECSEFSYGDYFGDIYVGKNEFIINIKSNNPMPSNKEFMNMIYKLGDTGIVNFTFSDIAGTYNIKNKKISATYSFAKNKTLKWLKVKIPFIPDFIMNATGDFIWQNGTLSFIPHNNTWEFSAHDDYFYIAGTSFKSWLPNLDLRFINDGKYSVSGFYKKEKISNLEISIADNKFSGSASDETITLHTDVLSIDSFSNKNFIDNFTELEFLTNDPILTLFELPVNISLYANTLIYQGNKYNNFVYSLKSNAQTFSITDKTRGNLLATINKDKTKYKMFAQLNKFMINGTLLSQNMPLNIRDTMITGELDFTTNGKIAHDIYYNMRGDIDLTFTSGYLIGMSFDNFYASAQNIKISNAEYALANALSTGETKIKSMRLVGTYDNGNFITTQPIELSMRHTDAIGGLAITNGKMTAEFDLTLRGTAPTPVTINLGILPNNGRQYSLSEIMREFDPEFMRAFIKTHDKF
ncbi:MAG: hypothetical protein ACLRFK_04310 [Alphaproteobacteria bacterium]